MDLCKNFMIKNNIYNKKVLFLKNQTRQKVFVHKNRASLQMKCCRSNVKR